MSLLDISEKKKAKIINGSLTKKIRIGICLLVVVQILLSFWASSDVYMHAGALMFYPFAIYLIWFGYRLGLIWLIVFRLFDLYVYWEELSYVPYTAIAFGVIFISLYFYGLIIETNRIRLQKNGEMEKGKPHTVRDSIIAVLIFIITSSAAMALIWDKDYEIVYVEDML